MYKTLQPQWKDERAVPNTLPSPREYFLETPLYRSVDLTSKEAKIGLIKIQFWVGTLDAFCPGCGQHSIFQSRTALPLLGTPVTRAEPARSVESLLIAGQALFPSIDGKSEPSSPQNVLEYSARPRYFQSKLICSRDSGHHLFFETKVLPTSFQKVGQYPSLADLHLGDLQKYRKVLSDDYSELARGIGLFAHGIGIGAFIYLRRVFERLIENAHVVAADQPGWDEALYVQSRMDERIRLLASGLPQFVVENRSVYQIMSKGIHELDEPECLEYFPVVRTALELMLDQKLEAAAKEEKVASTRASLQSILAKLKHPD